MPEEINEDEVVAAWLKGKDPEPEPKPKEDEPEPNPKEKAEVEDDGPPIKGDIPTRLRLLEERRKKREEAGDDKPDDDDKKDDDAPKPKDKGDKDKDDDDKPKAPAFRLPRKSEPKPPASETPPTQDEPTQEPPAEEDGPLSKEDEATLNDLPIEHRDAMEFWIDAEKVDPKYKGSAKKYLDYAVSLKAKIKELKEEDEDFDPQNSPELAKWIRQQDRPEASRGEMRRVDRMVIEKDLEQKQAAERQQQEQKLRAIEQKPKVQKEIDNFADEFTSDSIPEDVMQVYREAVGDDNSDDATEKGLEAVADEFGDEVADSIRSISEETVGTASAYLNVIRGVEPADLSNPHHDRANRTMIDMGRQILTNPKLAHLRERDGKQFVPAEKFHTLSAEERAKSYTLEPEDVLTYIKATGKARMTQTVKTAKEKAERRFQRRAEKLGLKKGTANADTKPPAPDPSPRRMPASSRNSGNDDGIAGFFGSKKPE